MHCIEILEAGKPEARRAKRTQDNRRDANHKLVESREPVAEGGATNAAPKQGAKHDHKPCATVGSPYHRFELFAA